MQRQNTMVGSMLWPNLLFTSFITEMNMIRNYLTQPVLTIRFLGLKVCKHFPTDIMLSIIHHIHGHKIEDSGEASLSEHNHAGVSQRPGLSSHSSP